MTDRIPTESGPDSPDPAYRDKRQRPTITRMGIEVGDIVESSNESMDDQWKVEGFSRDKATIRHLESGSVERVYDSWFKGVEIVE